MRELTNTNVDAYLSEQLSEMSFAEKLELGRMLERFEWHLAALPEEIKKLEDSNNQAQMRDIDLSAQLAEADLLIGNVRSQLSTWRLLSHD